MTEETTLCADVERLAMDADNLHHLLGALFSLETEFMMPQDRMSAVLHIAEQEAQRISALAYAMVDEAVRLEKRAAA